MAVRRIYGVDFSGARDAGRKIWVAGAEASRGVLRIEVVLRADCLPGSAASRPACLAALRDFIARSKNAAFGLDFPFSLPRSILPTGIWQEFIESLPSRFRDEHHFRQSCRDVRPGSELKRVTDNDARTPFSPYNLWLFRQTYFGIRDVLRPLVTGGSACVLPFDEAKPDLPWLLEICPASTLKRLGLREPYKGRKQGRQQARERIVEALEARGLIAFAQQGLRDRVIGNAGGDALDSVLAAIAVRRAVADPGFPKSTQHGDYLLEGYIYT